MAVRRVSASADHRSKSPSAEARKSKAPLLVDNRWRDSSNGTVAIRGARLVPWRTLHPYRAGFDSPALHFHPR
jgi:hypothetical protein